MANNYSATAECRFNDRDAAMFAYRRLSAADKALGKSAGYKIRDNTKVVVLENGSLERLIELAERINAKHKVRILPKAL